MDDEILAVIADAAGYDAADLKPNADLYKDLGMDSLEFAKLEQEAENRFGIEVDARAFHGCRTVESVQRKVQELIDAKGNP